MLRALKPKIAGGALSLCTLPKQLLALPRRAAALHSPSPGGLKAGRMHRHVITGLDQTCPGDLLDARVEARA